MEQALKHIIEELTIDLANSYINVGILGSKFRQQYGKSITDQIKELQLSNKFMKFLHSCGCFQIRRAGTTWEVGVKK